MGRSLLAVSGGWILIQLLVPGADEILMRVFPGRYGAGLPMPDWMTGLRPACGTLFMMAGAWLRIGSGGAEAAGSPAP